MAGESPVVVPAALVVVRVPGGVAPLALKQPPRDRATLEQLLRTGVLPTVTVASSEASS